jgi:flagella basal body P-ring formation protein FlgA
MISRAARVLALALLLAAAASGRAAGQQGTGERKVPVAARDIPRGVALVSADIAYRAATATEQTSATTGWVTRRIITAGEVLRAPAVSPPLLVNAGDEVEAVWRDGSLELRIHGRAMNAAAEGGRVSVRVDMARRFEGVAVAAGLVKLDSPSRSK